jgi:hypothetical protein
VRTAFGRDVCLRSDRRSTVLSPLLERREETDMDAETDRDIRVEDDVARDDKALRLRAGGRSFLAVAQALGYARAHYANDAFNRALRRKPAREQDSLRRQELARLNILAEDVRASQPLGPDDVARRLRTVERLRVMLLAE